MFETYKHYIELNSNGGILFGWSTGPTNWKEITDDAICINEAGPYQFRLFPDGEENPPLVNMQGIPLYHYNSETGEITKRSNEEIAADEAEIPSPTPSRLDKIEADQYYIAAMMGIDLDD